MDWAKEAKIENKRIAPATFDGLRGMGAQNAIASNDILVSVPRASAIVLAPRAKCPFKDFVTSEYWDAAPWFVRLALMLIHEQQQGAGARLAGYLEQLPLSVDLPNSWDDAMLQQLQYSHLITQVCKLEIKACTAALHGAESACTTRS